MTTGRHETEGGETVPFWELVRREAADAARAAWSENEQALRQTAVSYAREVGSGVLLGRGTPEPVPNVVAVTTRGDHLQVVDARNRSWRTLIQGLGIDIGFALLSVLLLAFGDFNFLDGAAWATLGVLVLKTVIQTALAYVARMKITPRYAAAPQEAWVGYPPRADPPPPPIGGSGQS